MISPATQQIYANVVAGLRGIGYAGPFLEENYGFTDWFSPNAEERYVAAAAFGQTPVSYDSALIGVAHANGEQGQALVNRCRALGAPLILEIGRDEIREWAVSRREDAHGLVGRYPLASVQQMLVDRAPEWRRDSLFRAKNIGAFRWAEQLGLFSGLLPELEEHIQEKLDPLLLATLSQTKEAYLTSSGREPEPAQLFQLVFWLLTAKVFRDRRANGFDAFGDTPDEQSLIAAVAKQYKTEPPRLLNQVARQVAAKRIWTTLDFRNLSVEVLSQIWSTTLVDDDTKKRLGIHRTSRTIVRYVIERIPWQQQSGDDRRIVLEPCCGSGVFLIGAMNALRHNLFGPTPAERHSYFVRHLVGVEKDPFGAEITRLALTLADFPNPGGWDVKCADVFEPDVLPSLVRRAGVVLCNPPFGKFDEEEQARYVPSSPRKPIELLTRVMTDLHPAGVLGFVLPRNFVDGKSYAPLRKRLAERYASLDLTVLPDRAFDKADPEVAILVATDPIPHNLCRVVSRKVDDSEEAWKRFELQHEVSVSHVGALTPAQAKQSLSLPALPDVWDYLINYPVLSEVAALHRGVEWNLALTYKGRETGYRAKFIRDSAEPGFRLGVEPLTKFDVFERPAMKYLSLRPEDQRRGSYKHPWHKPKAILNKAAKSRGRWRMAAFADDDGVTCYQTYYGVWPTALNWDEWLLAAVLNGPVANAFVATREGKTDITKETLNRIPVPHFTAAEADGVRSLIRRYQNAIGTTVSRMASANANQLLMEIDAAVMDAYRMPARLERQVLDWFHGADRPTPSPFPDYPTWGHDVFFSLSDHLSHRFHDATAGELLKRMAL